MTLPTTEQLYLAAVGKQDERELIAEEDLHAAIQEEISRMHTIIQRLRIIYFLLGVKATDPFYQMMKKSMFTDQRSTLCPRVRMDRRYQTPSFAWERIRQHVVPAKADDRPNKSKGAGRSYLAFVRRKGAARKEKAKVILTSEYLKINKKTQMLSLSAFAGEPEWARVAGLLIETRMGALRRQNRSLADISRAVHRFAARVEAEGTKDAVD